MKKHSENNTDEDEEESKKKNWKKILKQAFLKFLEPVPLEHRPPNYDEIKANYYRYMRPWF